MATTFHEHGSPDAMADAIAAAVAQIVVDAVAFRHAAFIAVPGGSTPVASFARLSAMVLPWQAVTIVPTDERVVPADSPLRNSALLDQWFGASGTTLVSLVGRGDDAALEADLAEARLRPLPFPLDLAWLGMGGDGHTASLFVGPDLEAALDPASLRRAVGVRPDPLPSEAPVSRISLTAAALASSRTVIVTITGTAKRSLVEQAICDGAASRFPVGRLLAATATDVAIHWSA
jgi:6-phosphogluconolactonase